MDSFIKKIEPFLYKITTQVHLLAVRDALLTVVPFLVLGGFATFFAAVFFTETGPLAGILDAQIIANLSTLFQRINNGTMGLLSLFLVCMIPYFLGNAKSFENPFILSMNSLAIFFVFNPLGGGNAYFGTQGVLLSILISLLSAELFMKLFGNEKLKWDMGGNVPAAVTRSFNSIFVIVICVSVFALAATAINLLSGLETIEWIYSVLQTPLLGIGASLPGAIIYSVIGGFFFTLGIQPSGIQAPIEAAMIAGTAEGTIFNQPFFYCYSNFGGCGAAWALVICLFLFTKRKEFKSVCKLVFFPEVFNISEPIMFGLPVVFNFIFLIPMICVPVIDSIIAYVLTSIGVLPVLTNTVVWSIPMFMNGFIASNGSVAVLIAQACLLLLDVALWLPFVKIYERQLNEQSSDEKLEAAAEA